MTNKIHYMVEWCKEPFGDWQRQLIPIKTKEGAKRTALQLKEMLGKKSTTTRIIEVICTERVI